jgi:hypothetical protein
MTNEEKMLEFVTHDADGHHGDTRAGKGWLVLQRKYFYENVDVPPEEVTDTLEEMDRDGSIYLFAVGRDDLDNIVIRLP